MDSEDTSAADVVIRPMTPTDLPALVLLDNQEDQDPWTQEIFMRESDLPISRTLVAAEGSGQGEHLVGFVTFWMAADELQLHKIVVRMSVRRRGIGRRLLQAMMSQALASGLRRAVLEVRCTNQAALHLYEQFGYRIEAVRKDYYGKDEQDALIMCAALNSGTY
jgi:ribosomal-protein-alanine N-acetyltransferase